MAGVIFTAASFMASMMSGLLVTRWSKLGTSWEDVSLDTIFADVKTDASYALVRSYGDYTTNLPLKDLMNKHAWIEFRFLVAEQDSLVVGYAGTTRFRPKAAYDTTVETTIYCAPESIGKGLGTQLYAALFATLSGENIHRIVAGYVPPNPISAALHARFGFKEIGVFSENGYKFDRYWDVCWMERPLKFPGTH